MSCAIIYRFDSAYEKMRSFKNFARFSTFEGSCSIKDHSNLKNMNIPTSITEKNILQDYNNKLDKIATGSLTYKQYDYFTQDTSLLLKELSDEKRKFSAYVENFGKNRIARQNSSYINRDYVANYNQNEWKNVTKLMPLLLIPKVSQKENSSKYIQSKSETNCYPYFVNRTNSNFLPVYIKYNRKKQSLSTVIRYVDGNLFVLQQELAEYLRERYNMDFISQVAEVYRRISFRGDFQLDFKEYLLKKGF